MTGTARDRIPLEQARDAAIGAAIYRYPAADRESCKVRSARLRQVGDMLIYDCLVDASWETSPVVYGFFGGIKEYARYAKAPLMIQVDAESGEVVGYSDTGS